MTTSTTSTGQQVRDNNHTAQQVAACQPSGCKVCERPGLPILPLRYAVVPKDKRKGKGPAIHDKLGKGVIEVALPGGTHEYALRALRQGYVYVLLDKKIWQGYEVTPQGLLRQFDPLQQPRTAPQPIPKACTTKGHDIPAQFLNIDVNRYQQAWVAFSQDAWTKTVLDEYKSEKRPAERFLKLDLAKLKTKPDGEQHAFELDPTLKRLSSGVEEYTKTAKDFGSIHGFDPRAETLGNVSTFVRRQKELHKGKIAAVVLMDTAAIIAELNHGRTKEVMRHQEWASSEEIAHKWLSSNAIKGVIESVKRPIRADVNKRFGGKPQTKELRYHGAYVATVTTTPEQQVDHEAGPMIRRIQSHYSEPLRSAFDKDYDKAVATHVKRLAERDLDYAAWLSIGTQNGRPSLDFLCEHDFDENDHACGAGYIRLVGECVVGGPNEHSLAWFKQKLPLSIDDPKQILFRSMVGNHKSFFSWVSKEKPDEAYDEIKALADAGKLDKLKWLAPAVAIYAHPAIAAIGAAAFIMNKDLSVDKALRDRIAHLAKIGIRLWEKLEVHTLKMRMSLGDYHQSLLRGAYTNATAKTTTTPKEAGKATRRLPPKLKLPPALANKTAEIMFWTTGKLEDILARFPPAPAQAAAADWVEASNKYTQGIARSGQNFARRALGPGQARELGTTLIKRLDTVAGSKTGILAIGAMILQWQQLAENSKTITTAGGEDAMSAAFGLGDASLSVISAGLEISSVLKAKVGHDKLAAARLLRFAAGFSAGAHLFNMVESVMKAGNKGSEGDDDSSGLYYASGAGFLGASYFSLTIALGSKATFLGPLLGLGPVGWGFICLGAALTLYFAAVEAEDKATEKWVARNKFWGKSSRKEKPYANWLEEAHALNILGAGIEANLNWSGKWMPGMDTIKMQVMIPYTGVEYGEWRYRLIALLRNGNEVEVANKRSSEKILPLPPLHPPRPMEMRAAPEKPKSPNLIYRDNTYTAYPEPKPGEEEKMGRRRAEIEHDFDIDSDAFSQVRLEFEYFEDVQDESGKGRIELTSEAK